jgi:hypothetical protein
MVRPRTVGECRGGIRPCPFVSCRFNLLVDALPDGSLSVRDDNGRTRIPRRASETECERSIDRAVDSWFDAENPPVSCALDVAREERTLEETGNALGMTRAACPPARGPCTSESPHGQRGR